MVKDNDAKQMDLATQDTNQVVTLGNGFQRGFEADCIKISRTVLLQKMSKQTGKPHGVGSIIDNITGELIGDLFTPLDMGFKEYVKFNPADRKDPAFNNDFEPEEVIWRTKDKNDPRVVAECCFGPNNEKPTATTFFNFLAIFEGQGIPIVISFKSTSMKAGEKLYNLIFRKAKSIGGNIYDHSYELFSETKTSPSFGDYQIYDLTPHGPTPPDLKSRAEAAFKEFHAVIDRLQADVSDEG